MEWRVLVAQITVIDRGGRCPIRRLITTSGFPAKLIAFVDSLSLQTWLLLLVINVLLLGVGGVLEPPAAILVLAPLLTPLVAKAGVDPVISV